MSAQRIAVLGAGISGLATAYRIAQKAEAYGADLEVYVLEAGPRPGGKVLTVRRDGWIFEGGPAGFLDNEPATLRLVDELNLRSSLLRSKDASRARFLYRNGRFHELKMSPLGFMASPLLSLPGRLRVVAELWQQSRRDTDEESVGSFGRRRLGREFTEVMLDSMVSGIHAADIDKLSLQAAFPKIAALERDHGGLFKGMAALKKQRKKQGGPKVEAGPGGVLHSFRGGMADPIEALVQHLGGAVRCGRVVQHITRGGAGYAIELEEGEGGDVHAVVLALPAFAAARAVGGLAPDAAEALGSMEVAGVHVVCAGYRRDRVKHSLQGFGALIPRSEGVRILGTIWTSSTFDGHAPDGFVQLRTLMGGAHDPGVNALSDDELLAAVQSETHPMYGIEGEPDTVEIFRWNRGIPQYTLGHGERLRRAEKALQNNPGLFLTGNSVCGVSFNNCVAHSEIVADRVMAYLESLGGSAGAGTAGAPPAGEATLS